MANLVTYAKQVWQDAKTAITAARLNNMEKGISDCANQINKLGDSVSLHRTALNNDRIRFEWKAKDGDNGLHVYVDNTLVAFIRQNTGLQHSVSSMVTKGGAEVIQLSWENLDGENYLCVRVNYVLAVKIKANV